ncbi:VanZ family protein [Sulfuricystis thermophila]|uniref:VanZ family protein n=1 Tax=Sulfuricystis thermophila TaxID=2496847 RepID=UPI0010357399|nr:VanZ family protein [Sulfuricystis thermophila]
MTARASSNLPLKLAGAWTLLVAYGSLYPFAGWRDTGVDPLAFLSAGWPRYFTTFDLAANVLAYLPLGFFWTAALIRHLAPILAIGLALLIGAGLSLGIEIVQNFLPSRVPSNLDFACNSVGALIGAFLGLAGGRTLLDGGRLHRWRERRFLPGAGGDAGLLLVAFWLMTQLDPESILFGSGNLRGLFGLPAALDFAAERIRSFELATVAAQTVAIALIGARLARARPFRFPLALILLALVVKSAALFVLMQGVHGLAWATPGTLAGLALGLLLWGAAMAFAPAVRQAIAALALMVAAVLVNLMPDNPYLADTLRVWQQGHFLNFNGLTRLATALWPFFALPWLMLSRSER